MNDICKTEKSDGTGREASAISDLLMCRCKDKYSIEKHGDGHALYWGRCGHRHGYNLLHITECSRQDILKHIEKCLNKAL